MKQNTYTYDHAKKQLVFLGTHGKPLCGISGPLAERVHKRMQNNTKTHLKHA